MSVRTILFLNKFFKRPEHPFNDESGDPSAYAAWEYKQAGRTLQWFSATLFPETDLRRKEILDIGCGAGGKSVYYAKHQAFVTGIDWVVDYRRQAEDFARTHGMLRAQRPQDAYTGWVRFETENASHTHFHDGSFDIIMMNDVFEHLAEPEAVLDECARLLRPGGRLYMNFTTYDHPYGEHLSDLIGIPWVHKLFPEEQCLEAYRRLAEELDRESERTGRKPAVSGTDRLRLRFSVDENGALKNSYINKMTLDRYKQIIKDLPERNGLKTVFSIVRYQNKLRYSLFINKRTKKYFVRMVVCVLEKPARE